MATMLAAQYSAPSPDVGTVKLVSVPVPQPKPGSAVVKVVTASVNPIDHYVMKGYMVPAGWSLPLPFTLGYDVAGYISALPEGDTLGFAVGDAVYAVNWGDHKHDEGDLSVGGTFAQYALLPLKRLSKKPAGLSFELAAALPLVGTTATQSLQCLNVQSGSKVLILGGSAAVGLLAIQLAKLKGAYVATTASARNLEFVSQFGPDKIINYQTEDWAALKDFDAVLEATGEAGAFKKASSGVLKPTGAFLSLVNNEVGFNPHGHPPLSFASLYGLSNKPADQEAVAAAVVAGKVKLLIDETFPFTQEGVVALLKKIEGGKSNGKNVLQVSAP